ncbi:hypothetical protein V2J09_024012 [Rumex salicifolius]
MGIDKDAMVISNEGRVGKKEKRGKKKHKEEENKDAVLLDIDSSHMENEKKRKREKEKRDGRELEMRNKKKKQNQEEEQNDVVDGNDEIEGDEKEKKKEKKKKRKENKTKDDMIAVDEKQKKMAKEKKKNVKKMLQDAVCDKTTTANHSGNGRESLGSNHFGTDGKDGKADCKGQTEKGKKKRKDHVIISHEEKNAVLAGNGEMNAMEADNQKEKKKKKNRKEKKANDDIGIDSSNPVKQKSKKVTFSDELNVFPPTDVSTDSIEQGDGYVRGKRFSKEEDEIIKKAVFDYIEANDLGEEGLDMVLHCSKHPKIRHCWHEISTALPHRPFLSFYLRAHTIFERGSRKWTPEDMELVRSSHEKYGSNWSLVAKDLGKFRQHIKDAWRRIKLANMKRGPWSQEEYQTLFELVNKDLQMKVLEEKSKKKDYRNLRDNISWEAISSKLGTRNSSLCTLKWYNQLSSPMVAEGLWADADDYRLLCMLVELDASCEDEVDWENLLEHRSGDVSLARWKQMYNHLGEYGNKSFSEQVEVLSKRYCPDLLEVREEVDNRRTIN